MVARGGNRGWGTPVSWEAVTRRKSLFLPCPLDEEGELGKRHVAQSLPPGPAQQVHVTGRCGCRGSHVEGRTGLCHLRIPSCSVPNFLLEHQGQPCLPPRRQWC